MPPALILIDSRSSCELRPGNALHAQAVALNTEFIQHEAPKEIASHSMRQGKQSAANHDGWQWRK